MIKVWKAYTNNNVKNKYFIRMLHRKTMKRIKLKKDFLLINVQINKKI